MKNNGRIKGVVLLVLLALAGLAKAQGYQSYFGADSTRLNVYMVCIDYDPTIYLVINSADTIQVNGQKYLQGFPQGSFADFFYFEKFYFREDTDTGRLYRYFPNQDQGEVLLCDMSLEVGDSFNVSDQWGTHSVVVESVSFENGRKVILFENTYGYMNGLAFYEGVFPSYYPIGFMDYYGCDSYMLCEYKDGEQVFDNPEFDACYIYYSSTKEVCEKPVRIFPTSIHFMETIHVEASEQIFEITLFDLYGRKFRVINSQDTIVRWNVAIPDDLSGVYIITIKTIQGIYHEKIIVNN